MVPPAVPVGAADWGAVDWGAVLGWPEAPGAVVAGGAVVAVEPPHAATASMAATPIAKARNQRVSDLIIVLLLDRTSRNDPAL
jgi:hypothetical protein